MVLYWGYLLDMIFGDPYDFPHPVRWIGLMIEKGESFFRKFDLTPKGQRMAGSFITGITVTVAYVVPALVLWGCRMIAPWFGAVIEVFMIFQILATCSLGREAEKVYNSLKYGDLEQAQQQIGMLVSRDTNVMDEGDICKATIETVSENFADGVIAPIFFIVVGGAPLGWAYKAVNTLDSMLGYKNERYLHMGRTAALLDDVCNWLPARISVVFVWMASFLGRLDVKQSVAIVKRDHDKHSSPNSAWPESAFAGALGIQLGGKASYFGKLEMKPTMGDSVRPVQAFVIKEAIQLMYNASFMGVLVLSGIRFLLVFWLA